MQIRVYNMGRKEGAMVKLSRRANKVLAVLQAQVGSALTLNEILLSGLLKEDWSITSQWRAISSAISELRRAGYLIVTVRRLRASINRGTTTYKLVEAEPADQPFQACRKEWTVVIRCGTKEVAERRAEGLALLLNRKPLVQEMLLPLEGYHPK